MTPIDAIYPATLWLSTTSHPPPYRSASGIGNTNEKLSKMASKSASYLFSNLCIAIL